MGGFHARRMGGPTVSRRAEFELAQAALIAEYADVLGPQRCSICEPGHCEHTVSDGTAVPIEGAYPTEWVLVHGWTNLLEGGGYWDWDIPQSMVASHAVGLLVAAKHDAEDHLRRRPA